MTPGVSRWLGAIGRPALSAWLLSGCGGAAPLLHPVHTLEPGSVSFAAGTSASALGGDAEAGLERARAVTSSGAAVTEDERRTLAEGALASVLAPPGFAPFIAARAGVAPRTEAGATYTGRWARLDLRHALEGRKLALGLGVGVSALLPHPSADRSEPQGTDGTIAGLDTSGAAGFGVDAPLLVGYRTGKFEVWAGPRVGFESAFGTAILGSNWPLAGDPSVDRQPPYEARFDGRRLWGAAVLGAAIGIVEPLHAAVEISARYFELTGTLRRLDTRAHAEVDGFSVEPSAAIFAHF